MGNKWITKYSKEYIYVDVMQDGKIKQSPVEYQNTKIRGFHTQTCILVANNKFCDKNSKSKQPNNHRDKQERVDTKAQRQLRRQQEVFKTPNDVTTNYAEE